MQKKTIDKWVVQGKKNCKSYVFYEDKVLDLSDFILQHPGGVKAIKNYLFKDITNILFEVYPHQKNTTLDRLMKYQVGLIPEQQMTNIRQKVEKVVNNDKPKERKKVCFTSDPQKPSLSPNSKHSNDKDLKKNMKKSTIKEKENLHQSTHQGKAEKNVSKSKSKSKKKQFITSIKVLNGDDHKISEDYFELNHSKVRQKQRACTEKVKQKKQKSTIGTFSFENNQLDEEKPNFRVPILFVKHMNKNV